MEFSYRLFLSPNISVNISESDYLTFVIARPTLGTKMGSLRGKISRFKCLGSQLGGISCRIRAGGENVP